MGGLGWRPNCRGFQKGDWRHEAVSAPGNRCYVVFIRLSVAERLSKGGNVHAQVTLFDCRVGPNPSDQLFLCDQLTGALDQDNQDVERATAKPEQLVTFEQKVLLRK
jgi:hypothetical protein